MRDEAYFRLRGWIPLPMYALVAVGLDPAPPAAWELALGGGLVAVGLALRAWARLHIGRSSDTRRLHARRLVTSGPYAVTRNPLYLGNVAIASGLAVWIGAGFGAALLALGLVLHYGRVMRAEERCLEGEFGACYRDYREATPRWLPLPALRRPERPLGELRRELRIAVLALCSAALALALRL